MRDLVVLIPGIGGSVLTHDGTDIWAPTPGAVLRGVLTLGGSLRRLTLDGDDPEADDLGDGVVATRVVPDLHVVPGLGWKIDGYSGVRARLLETFDCVPGHNYVELPYDWRRDNRVAARTLARNAHTWLARWREESGNPQAKLILVCHSMGGIVARLFLERFEGWRDTRLLITFGTPYAGSVNALDFLVNGFRKGWGPFTVDLSAMLRSFTSVYQLLPAYRCVEGPGGTWQNLDELDWSATALDGDRVRSAVGLHRALRTEVDARLATGVPGYDVRPVIGDFQRTLWAARVTGDRVEPMYARSMSEDGGDGTVPTVSASPHELLDGFGNATFVSQRHASLQNDAPVLDHVRGLLRGVGPPRSVPVFPAPLDEVALEVQDVSTEEPLEIRARSRRGTGDLVARLQDLASGQVHEVALTTDPDGWGHATLADLGPADYRVTVSGPGVHPATEVVGVVDLAALPTP